MISGRFGDNGELLFDIELIANNSDRFSIEALLDTGFTNGWLAINSQDLESLEWSLIAPRIEMGTAGGEEFFAIYQGKIVIDDKEIVIPVYAGDRISETLLGSRWLEIMELVVKKPKQILTLGFCDRQST
jgi:clan AA aspartic protease